MTSKGESYGHAYLSSYGWAGTGTALRKGAIDKPLAIPPKKNLSGLGKDRDEAFPFWDHLFTAASKAITIKVSNDDEDTSLSDSEDTSKPTDADASSLALKRTTTGIISNRRPITGTPASSSVSTSVSASGTTTPNPNASNSDTGSTSRLSLIATAKREAAKQGLYSRFFRGPVLGPDDDPSTSAESDTSSDVTPVPEQTLSDESSNPTVKNKKQKSEDREETKEERRERKRLRRERKAAKAAKKARKAEKALEKERAKHDGLRESDKNARKRQEDEARPTSSEERGTSPSPKKSRKRDRESAEVAGDPEVTKSIRKKLKKGSTATEEKDPPRIPLTDSAKVSATTSLSVVLTTKKKKGKRKDTIS